MYLLRLSDQGKRKKQNGSSHSLRRNPETSPLTSKAHLGPATGCVSVGPFCVVGKKKQSNEQHLTQDIDRLLDIHSLIPPRDARFQADENSKWQSLSS